jgi:hypothetical protein
MSKWIPSKKKNPVIKNQGWKPIQHRYKANDNTSRHNQKKKQKQTINQNQVKRAYAKKIHDYEMTIKP